MRTPEAGVLACSGAGPDRAQTEAMDLRALHAWYREALRPRIEELEQARAACAPEQPPPQPTRELAMRLHESSATYGFPRLAGAAAAVATARDGEGWTRVNELLEALREVADGYVEPDPMR